MRKILFIYLFLTFLIGQNINQIKNQIKDAGYTIEQARQIAKDRGLSENQIDSKSSLFITNKDDVDRSETSNPTNDNNIIDDNSIQINTQNIPILSEDELQYYGYNIFNGDPTLFQSSMFGAVDPKYNIGPGDQIIVMLWGE